jgi:hypothetical protein
MIITKSSLELGNVLSGQSLVGKLGITNSDIAAVHNGIAQYFNPETNEEAARWVQENQGHVRRICEINQQAADVQLSLSSADDRINSIKAGLESVQANRSSIDEERNQAISSFSAQQRQLQEELDSARQRVQDETALLPCKNPLRYRVGRFAVSAGRYALAAAVPLIAYAQQELLKANCSHLLSGSPLPVLSCATTLIDPRIYPSLLVGAGIAFVCNKAIKIGERILAKQQEADQAQRSLDEANLAYQERLNVFQQQSEVLDKQNSENLKQLGIVQENRSKLDARQGELRDQVSAFVNGKMKEIIHEQLGVLKEALKEKVQNAFVIMAGKAAVKSIFDAVVVAVAQQQPNQALIASSEPVMALPPGE